MEEREKDVGKERVRISVCGGKKDSEVSADFLIKEKAILGKIDA